MKKVILIVSVVILIGIILYFSLFYGKEGKGKEVYTYKVEKGDIISSVSASGSVEPKTKVNISSNAVGEIKDVGVKEGDRVDKGTFLVQLDKDRYLSEVEKLEAYLRMSRITLEKEKVNLENIENTFRRMQALHGERIISDDALEEAKLRMDTQAIFLKSLEEQVIQAEADLGKARDELKKTTIISPMEGVVTQLNAEVGEQALAGTINIPGTVIMIISDMSGILAEVAVDETEIVSVKKGQEAKIKVDAIGEKHEFKGIVEEIGNTALRKGEINIFPVKIRITDSDERLKPGMTARASIATEKREGVVRIPIQAVVSRNIEKEKEKAKETLKGKKGKKEKKKEEAKKEEAREENREGAQKGSESAEKQQEAIAEEGSKEKSTREKAGRTESEKSVTGADSDKDSEQTSADSENKATSSQATGQNVEKEAGGTVNKDEKSRKKDEEHDAVYLMIDGKASLVAVEVGISDELHVEIKSGLKEGDVVVTGPYRLLKNLKEGEKIKEKEEKGEGEKEEEKEEGEEEKKSEVEVRVED